MFDEKMFNDIVAKYREELLKYCASKLRNNHFAAEEITNDVFMTMYQKWDAIHFTGIKTWLVKTANNRTLHYFRDRRRELIKDEVD